MKRYVILALSLFFAITLLSCKNDTGTTIPFSPPTITSMSPSRVSRADHVTGTITGTNLSGASSVSFGDEINVEEFTVLSSTAIEVKLDVNNNAAAASHTLTIVSPAGTATAPNILTVIDNRAPIAHIEVAPLKGATNTDFTFDGQSSIDKDGKVISYQWDFGDGKTKIGPVVSHTYAATGNYEVVLSATDNDEATGQTSISVQVIAGIAPTAKFVVSPKQGDVLTTYTFDASNSDDPDGKISKYEWDFGDGRTAEGKVVQKNFSNSGIYDVTLIVTDNKGLQSSYRKDVTVGAFDSAKATKEIRDVVNTFFYLYSNMHQHSTDDILVNWSRSAGCPGYSHEAHIIDQQRNTIQQTSAIPTGPAEVTFGSTKSAHAVVTAHFVWTNYDGTGGNAYATHDFQFIFEDDQWQVCSFTVY